MTLAIFKLSGKMLVVKDTLYMKDRCLAIPPLANFNTFMGMLFIPITLLLLRLDIIYIISFSVQGDNDSLQGSVK